MPKTFTPAIRFANRGSTAGKSFEFVQTVERSLQVPSDHATEPEHFSGVLRFRRDFRRQLVKNKFNPTVTFCNPSTVPTFVNSTVHLTGSNFYPGMPIFFNGLPAISSTFVGEHNFDVICPRSPDDLERPIIITCVSRQGEATDTPGLLQYENNPILLSLNPNTDFTVGGALVIASGQRFKQGSVVMFRTGSNPPFQVPNVTWINDFELDLFSPNVNNQAGVYLVKVRSPSGMESSELQFFYTLHRSHLTQFVPTNTGSSGGGEQNVFLQGTFFINGAAAVFGSTTASTIFIDSTTLKVVPPAGAAGGTAVYVVNGGDGVPSDNTLGWFRIAGLFVLNGVSPNTGTNGTAVQLTGANFTSINDPPVTSVFIGATSVAFSLVAGGQKINTTVPNLGSANGVFNVQVSGTQGQATLANAIRYITVPVITSITPTGGPTTGGTAVVITGSNFLGPGECTITFGGTPASFTVNGGRDQIVAVSPAHSPGAVNVVIATTVVAGVASVTASQQFTYTAPVDAIGNFQSSEANASNLA